MRREAMSVSADKHIIDGYEEKASLELAERAVILAEKAGADEPYMVVTCKWDNPLGANEYYSAVVTADYLEAAREFIKREAMLLSHLEAERSLSGLPIQAKTAGHCLVNSHRESFENKVVLVKPEALSPEYRSAEFQIGYCTGGFGARPGANGKAIFCTMLHSGKNQRFERGDIAGVIDPKNLPEWTKPKLAALAGAREQNPATLAGQIAAARTEVVKQNCGDAAKRDKGRGGEER
jgi:hypothetical protein